MYFVDIERNSQYHRICARHSKEVLDLLYGVDKSKNVVELNAAAEDDHSWITDSKKWVDYTELPDGNVDIVASATDVMSEDELVANGYQLTDTGWVKA